jgi:hypothetical protein
MKYRIKTPTLFAAVILITTTLLSQVLQQNVFDISVDPKYASTVFIDSDRELKVETWDKDYILFQIEVKPHSDAKQAMIFLEMYKQDIIKEEFTVNNFLHLTIADLDKILQFNDCNPDQIFSYKIIAPKSLDLELRCKNDLVFYDDDSQENFPTDPEKIKASLNK